MSRDRMGVVIVFVNSCEKVSCLKSWWYHAYDALLRSKRKLVVCLAAVLY